MSTRRTLGDVTRAIVGLLARAFILIAFVAIVVHAAWTLFDRGATLLGVLALVFPPVTLFVWPIFSGAILFGVPLWVVLGAIFVAYPISTLIGRMPAIDRPGDLLDPATWVPAYFHKRDAAYWQVRYEASLEDTEHLFDEAEARYSEKAALADPPVDDAVIGAVLTMRDWLGSKLNDQSKNGLSTLGIRGYLWRDAENGPWDFIEEEVRESVKRSLTEGPERGPDEERAHTLFHAAVRCLEDDVPVGRASPGGLVHGWEFYFAALDRVRDDFDEYDFDIPDNEQKLAFRFGVCLRDADRALAEGTRPEPPLGSRADGN